MVKVDSASGMVTVDGEGAETIDGQTEQYLKSQYSRVTMVCDGSNWILTEQNKPTFGITSQTKVHGSTYEEGVWYSFTGESVGWSSTSNDECEFMVKEKTIHIKYFVNGTSNSTQLRIAKPIHLGGTTGAGVQLYGFAAASDNGGTVFVTTVRLRDSAYTDYRVNFSDGTDNGWTSSGAKWSRGQFFHSID